MNLLFASFKKLKKHEFNFLQASKNSKNIKFGKMTRPYHFKKFDFPKGISLQKSNFLKR